MVEPGMWLDVLLLIPFCIAVETASVICFKHGVNQDEQNPADIGLIRMVLTKPILWLGIVLWAVELAAWITVLEHTPLSIAYPFMSVIYCTVPLAGKYVLGEPLPPRLWPAAAMIAAGVALVGSTGV